MEAEIRRGAGEDLQGSGYVDYYILLQTLQM